MGRIYLQFASSCGGYCTSEQLREFSASEGLVSRLFMHKLYTRRQSLFSVFYTAIWKESIYFNYQVVQSPKTWVYLY